MEGIDNPCACKFITKEIENLISLVKVIYKSAYQLLYQTTTNMQILSLMTISQTKISCIQKAISLYCHINLKKKERKKDLHHVSFFNTLPNQEINISLFNLTLLWKENCDNISSFYCPVSIYILDNYQVLSEYHKCILPLLT